MLVCSIALKSKKGLARDVFDTFATHTDLAHDVTDTDCWARNDSTHGRCFVDFKHQFFQIISLDSTNKTRNCVKNCCVLVSCCIPFQWKEPVLLRFGFPATLCFLTLKVWSVFKTGLNVFRQRVAAIGRCAVVVSANRALQTTT